MASAPQYWVDGKYVVVRYGDKLPDRCIYTNEPVTPRDVQFKSLYYVPLGILIGVPLGVICATLVLFFFVPRLFLVLPLLALVAVMVTGLLKRRVQIGFGLSPTYRKRAKWWQSFATVIGVFSGIVFCVGFWHITLIGIVIAVAVHNLTLYAPRIWKCERGFGANADEFWLYGFSSRYLDQLEEEVESFDDSQPPQEHDEDDILLT
ncbi:MAG: hypothetical protein H6824_04130 [Planctomycetaceae bacterium]|nr:hypothetical protein [Planctomycetaceae bacterium]